MNDALTLSPAGLKLVRSFEGCEQAVKGSRGRFRAYVDPVGILTMGWGHTNATGRKFKAGDVWTQAECDAAQSEIDNAPTSTTLTDAKLYAMIDS